MTQFPKGPARSLSAKQKLVRLAYQSPSALGISRIYAARKKSPPTLILMYHSIPRGDLAKWINPSIAHSPELFEEQISFLAKYRNVISLAELVERQRANKPFDTGTVVLTFDDGFRDNFEVAAPLLKKYDLPATIFLATSFIDQQRNIWCDQLYGLFGTRTKNELCIQAVAEGKVWNLSNANEAYSAFQTVAYFCIDAALEVRDRVMNEVEQQLAPSTEIPCLMMSWDDARQMRKEYPAIEFGGHTANHLNLATNPNQIESEVMESLTRIGEELGTKPRFLACPYNRHNAEVEKVLSGLPVDGVVAEFIDKPVVRSGKTSCLALPRLGGPYRMPLLRDWSSGAYPDLAKKLFKRYSTELY